MAHLAQSLPQRVEIIAVRRIEYDTEIVAMDSGREVRNNRHAAGRRTYEISMPLMLEDDDDYVDTRDLYDDAGGMLHSFNFHDFTDSTDATVVAVRFDSPLQITAIGGGLFHIDTFTLKEELGEDS